MSECVSERVSELEMSECFMSIKKLMPYADIHFVKV